MVNLDHPWQVGPTELIEFALDRMRYGSEFDRRLAFLILDVGVETLFKTFLTLPDNVMPFHLKRSVRLEAARGNFHERLWGIQNANPQKAAKFNFAHIEHYHNLRNMLYHPGNQVKAVSLMQLKGYAALAVELLREYLEVDLSAELIWPDLEIPTSHDPVVDTVEVKVALQTTVTLCNATQPHKKAR